MKNPMKTENRQFYKFWKKSCKEICNRKLFMYRIYHSMCSCSLKVWKPIYEIVEMFLVDDANITGRDVEEKLGILISEKETQAVLCFSGYKYSPATKTYYRNPEMTKCLHNVCDATRICINSDVPITLTDKFKRERSKYYNNKSQKYKLKSDRLALNFNPTAYEVEPANGERTSRFNGNWQKFWTVVMILAVLGVLIRGMYVNNAEDSSDAQKAFWNAILGATIPGIVTIITTHWIIKHQYKVDYHSERMGAMPVFSLSHLIDKNQMVDNEDCWDEKSSNTDRFYNTAEIDDLLDKDVDIFCVTNKGRGMAFNITRDRGDQIFSFGDLAQEEKLYIALRKCSPIDYVLTFMDIYGNKYCQRFCIIHIGGICEISSYPPELILRTNLVRYQQ